MSTDHRSRVGADRRKRMRERLVSSALHLIAEQGWQALSVDSVIESAGVSRGSFYKYFESIEDLTRQLASDIASSLVSYVGPLVEVNLDPALRVATGVRLVMHTCRNHPLMGQCVAKMTWADLRRHQPLVDYVWRDIEAGLCGGRFTQIPLELAVSTLVGITICGVEAMLVSGNEDLPEITASMVLRALGVSPEEAEILACKPMMDSSQITENWKEFKIDKHVPTVFLR